MPDALPPYTADRPLCSKCGHGTAGTRYTASGEACGLFSRLTAVDALERLCRQCERCGHHWDEALASRDQAAPCRGHVPLGQQFRTDITYAARGESHLRLAHLPSGLHNTIAYPNPAAADAGEYLLRMFQTLLDEVDAWQREPIEAATDA